MFLLLTVLWTQLLRSESSAVDPQRPVFPSHHSGPFPPPPHPQVDPSHRHRLHRHHQHYDGSEGGALPGSRFLHRPVGYRPLDLLVRPNHQVQPEHAPVSPQHLVSVYLAVDVRRLNVSLLRWFRDGVAAALGIPAGRVHINRLNEEKNSVELFVSSDRLGVAAPRPADEVIQSLDVRVLHHHLGHFGITEVSTEKNVLQGEPNDQVWSREGLYTLLFFFTVFVIVVTCLMVLYRLKEKAHISDGQLKAPPRDLHLTLTLPPKSAPSPRGTRVVSPGSMVRAELPPTVATPTLHSQPIMACGGLAPPIVPSSAPATGVNAGDHDTALAAVAPLSASQELKPCPSPFRMKAAAGLQERRGSNVSLVLDMSALGSLDPLDPPISTPRGSATREYLTSAGRPLTRPQLRGVVNNTHALHAQFTEIPMNFTDPKDLDVPNHGTKNRYKTILPNLHSRVVLKSKSCTDRLSSYINANYIRGYLGEEKAFIATQGPMVNTVNDFWQMAWQEESPVIVMITKLKEKNEKCVLYWPEKRGIYGSVEVLVNTVTECEHYTIRSLALKCGNQTRTLQHYWYTSWPDHKTPDSALPLLELMSEVETDRRNGAALGPVIVHCSAGIGRTGCFIATTIGCRQLKTGGAVDVLGITCQLRADRGGMIQTAEQYQFVHHALSLYEAQLSAGTDH